MPFSIRKRVYLGLFLTFSIAAGAFVYAIHTLNESIQASVDIENRLRIITQMEVVHSRLKDAQIGQRNFLLTQNPRYLKPYQTAQTLIKKDFQALWRLARQVKPPPPNLTQLQKLTQSRLDLMEETLRVNNKQAFKAALALIQSGEGQDLMERIERQVQEVGSVQEALIQSENALSSDQAYTQFFTLLITGLVSLSLFSGLFILVYRLGVFEEAKKQIRTLESRVEEETRETNRLRLIAEASAERYRLILEGSNDGIWEWDLVTHQVQTNEPYRRLLGLEDDMHDSVFFTELLHPEDVDKVMAALGDHYERKRPYKVEMRLKNQKTGMYIPVLAHGTAILDAENRPVRMAGTHTDLRALKMAEEALSRSEAKFRRIAESDMIGIIFALSDGTVYEANDYFLNLVGCTRAEIFSWRAMTPSEFIDLDNFWTEKALAGEKVTAYEKQLIHKDGRLIDVIIGFALQENSSDDLVAFILDNTESKKAEQAILQYSQQLKASNQELEHFATIVSHDLQAPLRKVLIFTEFMQQSLPSDLDETNRDYLSRIHKSVSKLQVFITDLLELSRVNRSGKPFTVVSLDTVMSLVAENLGAKIRETGATLTWDVEATIEADEQQMEQLLRNLVENALKYRQPDVAPIITVSCVFEADTRIHLMVQDNGIGIQKEYFERIFEIFQRLHGLAQYEGSGVGLATAKRIVARHQGEIWVDSEFGKGACFHVRLPIRRKIDAHSILGSMVEPA